jgi:hypothetical protein
VELCSLHPVSDTLAAAYVQQLKLDSMHFPGQSDAGGSEIRGRESIGSNGIPRAGLDDRQLQQVGFGLAQFLALEHPTFAGQGLALTSWEARVDRGIAMLVRPPSRLFADAGLPVQIARRIPIRLDLGEGMMGGGYIPARLMPQAQEMVYRNIKRSVRRMIDAEMNATTLQALMMEAVDYAAASHLGLFEAVGLVDFSDPATWPPGSQVHNRPSDKGILQLVADAARPDPKPSRISRLFNRLNHD